MTLPRRPNAIFSTLQGSQNPGTKPTLQRAKNANTQPTHPGRRISINISTKLQQYIITQHPSPPTTRHYLLIKTQILSLE
ncbi:MAG: hypothetical protein JST21_08155 [Bacteroidetes bacterium]|nr:hypothetical protein [Bacteroidota bacterium]